MFSKSHTTGNHVYLKCKCLLPYWHNCWLHGTLSCQTHIIAGSIWLLPTIWTLLLVTWTIANHIVIIEVCILFAYRQYCLFLLIRNYNKDLSKGLCLNHDKFYKNDLYIWFFMPLSKHSRVLLVRTTNSH